MTTAKAGSKSAASGGVVARPADSARPAVDTGRQSPAGGAHPSPASIPHNNLLLPRSPLIGRDHELAAVQHLLLQEKVGLLTLTGPGGIGKTRLALQVAANLLDHFVDGVYFVSLAPIRDVDLVIPAIAQTLGVREAGTRSLLESLQAYLRDRQLLLVLDNFEQVVAAAPLVADLLATCQRLKTLVTSRAMLHLYGEHEFPVPPLALPDPKRRAAGETDLVASVAHYAAVELFVQRALAAQPDFALTAINAAVVAEICIGLDGLPLAIELAAARIKLFSPPALLARLQQRLTLLTGGAHDLPSRQRTLRDEIAWSYDLLTAAEQTLFRRLAVFVGGFTLEAAQAVGDADGRLGISALDGVATLVDHNLLKRIEPSGSEPRFGMLETIREYGLERLEASGEAEVIRRHHLCYFLALAEATEETGREQVLARLAVDLDNLRAAVAWSQTPSSPDAGSRAELGLRLAGALVWFAFISHHYNEVRGWLIATLQRTGEPTAIRAKGLWGAGLLAATQGDYHNARTELEESVALWRMIGDRRGLATALRELCLVAHAQRQFAAAQRYGEESVALYRTLGSPGALAVALDNLGTALAAQGDYLTARRLFEEELALSQTVDDGAGIIGDAYASLGWLAGQQGDDATAYALFEKALAIRRGLDTKWTVVETLNLLGEVLQRQGKLEQAGRHYAESLVLAREVGDKTQMALLLQHLATIAQTQTQVQRAVRLSSVAAALRTVASGNVLHTLVDPAEQERGLARLHTLLGEEVFATLWAEGQAMGLEQAIEYALAVPPLPESAPAAREDDIAVLAPLPYAAGLTAREVEVLRLLAQGLTYAQIADNLVISRRTVNTHVTSIFGKLDVSSRAAATRFAIDHHLV
jgi:predicted ATPase/DNA-binding CsgD family transcriptional regulator